MIDIWALGCIFAELMKVSEPYVKPLLKVADSQRQIQQLTYNRVLFQGDSCYPMSPLLDAESGAEPDPEEATLTENDQLVVICRKLISYENPKLSAADETLHYSFISDDSALQY